MRTGVDSVEFGDFLIDFGGAWVAYRDGSSTTRCRPTSLSRVNLDTSSVQDIGATAGAALAGDADANQPRNSIKDGPPAQDALREVVSDLLDALAQIELQRVRVCCTDR